ncbi:helix-turn-helix transcriptional regulator [Konateibacter massiliensis]|uniref:helix-turn-helix transcriptional regulator n=1 Tax=Konateibacter massiliensis TaxID=2002841 RepID=UPI000C15D821|nr:helix-turn-helix transcriptional regulator [Konateibacter massiliensis]
MYNEMTFGKCLKFFLSTLDLKMSQLARAINVDNSLVSLWINEKRLPSTIYIDSITGYLAVNINNPLQAKLIDELFSSLPSSGKIPESGAKEKIYKMLLASLKHSALCKEQEKKSMDNISDRAGSKTGKPLWDTINLSHNDKLIYSIPSIFSAYTSLLERGKRHSQKENNIIYVTYHNILDHYFFSDQRLDYLKNTYLEAINNGWQINILLKLDNSINNVIKFIAFIFPLIKTGKLKLYHMTNQESFMIRKELYIVPGIGAMSCFPTDACTGINSAFYFENKSAVETLTNYAKLLITDNSNNILKYYTEDIKAEYFGSLMEMDEQFGNQFSYNSSFSRLLLPKNLYKKLIIQTDLTEQEKELSIHDYQKQANCFLKNLQHHQYKDIYFTSTLEELCQDKLIYLYTCTGIKVIPIESLDAIEYLTYAINVIKSHDNYHIALMLHDIEDIIKNSSFFIKERKVVNLNIFEKGKGETGICLSINDPVIVKAFVEYYNSLWQKILPLYKEKKEVILLLESYIAIIHNELIKNEQVLDKNKSFERHSNCYINEKTL